MSLDPSPAPLPQPSPADVAVSPALPADLAGLAEAVTAVVGVDVQHVSATQRKERLARLRAAIDTLEVCFDTTVAACDTACDGPLLDGATSTTAWLRHTLHLAPREAASHVRTARTIGPNTSHHHPDDSAATRSPAAPAVAPAVAAVLAGSISYPHLQTITATLTDLADHTHLPDQAPTQAVALMVNLATTVDPAQLRAAARHLRYVLDPDRGKADHDRQTQTRRATLAPPARRHLATGNAHHRRRRRPPHRPAQRHRSPHQLRRHPHSLTQRRHDTLIDALQAAAQSDQLPIAGGLSPHILITTPPQAFLPQQDKADEEAPRPTATNGELRPDQWLAGQWRPARFADGTPIPGPLFDQLTCSPSLTRITQEPSGRVLDVGRTHRFFTPTQRTALYARDHGCRFPGCTAPWTHAHHITSWQHGGTTDLTNGVLLCGHHHRTIHHRTWTITCGPDGANGTITFTHRGGLTTHHSPIPPPDPLTRE